MYTQAHNLLRVSLYDLWKSRDALIITIRNILVDSSNKILTYIDNSSSEDKQIWIMKRRASTISKRDPNLVNIVTVHVLVTMGVRPLSTTVLTKSLNI